MVDFQHTQALETIYAHITRQSIKLLALCSLQSQSGNSSLAMALARRGASSGRKVLLIELNNDQPVLHLLQLAVRNKWLPLTDDWRRGVQFNVEPNLSVLIAPKDSVDLVQFHDLDTMKTFLNQARDVFDLVICDCAPLLVPSSSQIPAAMICSACEHSIINVLTNINTESQLEEAREILRSCKANLVGAIMNDQYAPSLRDELLRESQRLNKLLPNLMNKMRQKLRHSDLLNQDL
ncbi:MAG: hypothetical protein HRU06_03090 [Oceanospirillaceae bacterium]|nr:hypothetical protein [Oceanospirillaceae bacterium]